MICVNTRITKVFYMGHTWLGLVVVVGTTKKFTTLHIKIIFVLCIIWGLLKKKKRLKE